MSGTLIVIPARLGSTRFPGKVLKLLAGVPVVEWCRRAAVRAKVGPVVVATEEREVARAVESFGGEAVLTSARCHSGTDRVHQAVGIVEKSGKRRFSRVINLQGDEPFILPSTITKVARLLEKAGRADMSTAVVPLGDAKRGSEPSVVKAVVAADGRCLYFSRSPVPFNASNGSGRFAALLQHIGIYGFRREALERFVKLPPSPLELLEKLEQLRAMEAGMNIFAARVTERTMAIDTPEDLRRAQKLAKERPNG